MLLHRYSGSKDLAVGMPIANRSRREVEPLIGFFVNTVVVRTDLSDDPTFSQALARVRKTALEAYDHQEVPFERLVEELAPRDLSRNPLFQVAFQLFNAPSGLGAAEGMLTSRPVNTPDRQSRSAARPRRDRRSGRRVLEYSTALWDPEPIARMADHYRVLLEAVVANPDCAISRLALTTGREREQLAAWTHGGPATAEGCIQHMFEDWASRTPDAVAVIDQRGETTFGELNRRANQLARYLRGLGVVRGSIVGVCTGRSVDVVLSFLAILKAGAACRSIWLSASAFASAPSAMRQCPSSWHGCAVRGSWLVTAAASSGSRMKPMQSRTECSQPRARDKCAGPRVRDLHLGVDGCSEGCAR